MSAAESPQQTSPPRSYARFVPWLIMVVVLLLFAPVYLLSLTLEDVTAPLATEMMQIQATLTTPPLVPAEEQILTDQLLDLRVQLAAVENVVPTVVASHIDWPAITTTILRYDATLVRITRFSHNVNMIVIDGDAMQESNVLDYAEFLKQSDFFSRVVVQSITLNPVQPATVNPAVEPTEGAPALTEIYMPFVFSLSVDLRGNSVGLR